MGQKEVKKSSKRGHIEVKNRSKRGRKYVTNHYLVISCWKNSSCRVLNKVGYLPCSQASTASLYCQESTGSKDPPCRVTLYYQASTGSKDPPCKAGLYCQERMASKDPL